MKVVQRFVSAWCDPSFNSQVATDRKLQELHMAVPSDGKEIASSGTFVPSDEKGFGSSSTSLPVGTWPFSKVHNRIGK